MEKALHFIAEIFIFLAFLCLISDVSQYRMDKERIKDALDLSTKAAVMQVDTNPNLISQGNFQIDNTKAQAVFLDMMSKNTGMNINTIINCMYEYKAINVPGDYVNPADGQTYHLDYLTFVSPMRFKFHGLLLSKDIVLYNNFAGSQLRKR